MSGFSQRVRIRDNSDVQVEPPPDVDVIVEYDGIQQPQRLSLDEPVEVFVGDIAVKLTMVGVAKRAARRPTVNGKTMFVFHCKSGLEHKEYVRSQERAEEMFREKYPNEEIDYVSTE